MSDDDGFVSRWSRRKAQVRSAQAVSETPIAPLPLDVRLPAEADASSLPADRRLDEPPVPAPPPLPPPPTLADVAQLGPDSDFSRFVTPGVDETVKHAAMKKLFADPHFNVMDGLDTYIDDYGKPDPIPEAMLRRMTQSKLLRLFEEEQPQPDAQAQPVVVAAGTDGAAAAALPQSPAAEPGDDAPEAHTDEDTALRLQPDDAADPAGAGPHRPGARP
jgi:hypothetical protein